MRGKIQYQERFLPNVFNLGEIGWMRKAAVRPIAVLAEGAACTCRRHLFTATVKQAKLFGFVIKITKKIAVDAAFFLDSIPML
jgi:hypothetical protein